VFPLARSDQTVNLTAAFYCFRQPSTDHIQADASIVLIMIGAAQNLSYIKILKGGAVYKCIVWQQIEPVPFDVRK
jgi:hypothetical protein